jgi:hypothetical protein
MIYLVSIVLPNAIFQSHQTALCNLPILSEYYTHCVIPDEHIATPDLATPDLATPDPATPDLATPDLATPDPATPDLATPDPATPDPATPDFITLAGLQSRMEYVMERTAGSSKVAVDIKDSEMALRDL